MSLVEGEIEQGVVAYFEVAALLEADDVQYSEQGAFRDGPFVCIQSQEGKSTWLQITGQRDKRGIRLELVGNWRLDGSPRWRADDQFVHDARKPFTGPNVAFVSAAKNERSFAPFIRPRIALEGVDACLNEVRRYKAPLL